MSKKIKNSVEYILKKNGKKTGFSVPSDYFNDLEETIAIKLLEKNFSKEHNFEVPATYFNNLEDTILASVSPEEKETKVISFKERILKFIPIAAAASVILFIGLNSFVFNKTEELTLDSLSDVDIEYWLDSNTINTNDVTVILQEDLLDEDDFYFATLEDENIEDYINSIDNTSIFEELN